MFPQRIRIARLLSLCTAVVTLSAFSSSEVRNSAPQASEAPQPATILVGVYGGDCQGCHQWEERQWCTYWFCWQEKHEFTGFSCSGGGNELASRDEAKVVLTGDGEGEEGETRNHSSYCAACGNTSRCHTAPEDGPCHERGNCSSGGGTEMKGEAQRVRASVRIASAAGIAEVLSGSKYAFYNVDRQAIQFRSPCDPKVIADQVSLSDAVALELERALTAN